MNGVFEFDQAKALAASGHEVVYLAADIRSIRRARAWGFEKKRVSGVSLFVLNVPLGSFPWKARLRVSSRAIRWLIDHAIRDVGLPDVVHSHFALQGLLSERARDVHRAPVIYTEHCSKILTHDRAYMMRSKEACMNADRVIAVSNTLAFEIKDWCTTPPAVIWNVVDTDTFAHVDPIAHDGFRFVSVGSLIDRKGYDTSLRAFAELARSHGSNLHYSIVGEGPLLNDLKKLAKELDIEGLVTFVGLATRNEIAQELAKSDCFVLASNQETFGVCCIEAMAVGIPIVATKCGGPEDFIESETGILVNPEDSVQLRNAMTGMAFSPVRAYPRSTIQKAAIDRFSPNAIATMLEKEYLTVLNGSIANPFSTSLSEGS